jgi:hypothetical protein
MQMNSFFFAAPPGIATTRHGFFATATLRHATDATFVLGSTDFGQTSHEIIGFVQRASVVERSFLLRTVDETLSEIAKTRPVGICSRATTFDQWSATAEGA